MFKLCKVKSNPGIKVFSKKLLTHLSDLRLPLLSVADGCVAHNLKLSICIGSPHSNANFCCAFRPV